MQVVPDFNYIPSPTGIKFHESDAKYKLVVGPYGSGKTCMIMNDAKYYCLSQAPGPDGVRQVCIGVVRSTFGELKQATRKSILEIFPAAFGTVNETGSPLTGFYRFPVGDGPYDYLERGEPWHEGCGTFCAVEFNLIALDGEKALDKLRSVNWTFAILNEASTMPFEVIAALNGRTGRFPTETNGVAATYSGILADTNQPPRGHWLLDYMRDPPEDWAIFKQPPAAFRHVDPVLKTVTYTVNPAAENLRNLSSGIKPDDFKTWDKDRQEKFLHDRGLDYYQRQIDMYMSQGRSDKVDNLFCMLDVPLRVGLPVFGLFDMERHVLKHEAQPVPYRPVVVGYDTSGVHPGVVFLQQQNDRWVVLDELYGENVGMEAFLEQALMPLVASKYGLCDLTIACDPANAKDSYTGLSPSAHLVSRGFKVYMPKTNDPKTRIRAVDQMLNKIVGGLAINPHLHILIGGMQGGYYYKQKRVTGTTEDIYETYPEKNSYSHVADALQYACLYIIRENPNQHRNLVPLMHNLAKQRNTLRTVM